MSAPVASPHQRGTCAVELLQLEWQAFRTQDRAPLGVAERLLDERPWMYSAEHGALEDAVASLLQLRDTVGTMIDEEVPFTERAQREINSLFEKGVELLECLRDALVTENRVLLRHIIGSGAQYAQLAKDYGMAHQQRLEEGVCRPRASSVYLQMLDQLGGLEWHVRQIAQQLALRHGPGGVH